MLHANQCLLAVPLAESCLMKMVHNDAAAVLTAFIHNMAISAVHQSCHEQLAMRAR